ncbi:MAG: tetratricopeptide repeat protein, partial [Chloroflexota bacterium]
VQTATTNRKEQENTLLQIDPYLLLLLIGFLFIVVFGGLSLMRREGLSGQFTAEALALIALMAGGSWLAGAPLNPFAFLAVLYLITMRSRLLVDVANLLARRGNHAAASKLYRLGLVWRPDTTSRLIVLSNRGAAELHSGDAPAAIATLSDVLSERNLPRLGIKYEAATRYNLGLAYETAGQWPLASAQYNEALDTLPGSPYARAAAAALKRHKQRGP